MIDGINISHHAPHNTHLKGFDCWEIVVNEKTLQQVSDRRRARLRAMDMQLIPSKLDGYTLVINGSLHKYHNLGEHNADQFSFSNLVQSIDSLSDITGVAPNDYELHGLEIGINIHLPFPLSRVFKNLVCFGTKEFNPYFEKHTKIGHFIKLDRYKVKLYDKAKQSGKNCGNVLRFEVSINKMQALEKYRLHSLADLQQAEKVYPLIEVLQDALNNMIFTDSGANISKLSDKEVKQWLYYSNPRSWQSMSIRQRKHHRPKWKFLLNRHGNLPDLQSLIFTTWKSLFEADKMYHSHRPTEKNKQLENVPFAPFIYTVHSVQNDKEKTTPLQSINKRNIKSAKSAKKAPSLAPRFCCSCGSDITHQRKQSIFCSARYVGTTKAKQCRNKNSNDRNHKKEKIIRAMTHQNFIAVTYTGTNGEIYTDPLHPSEIAITRQWLDRVQSITILPTARSEAPEKLDGLAARKELEQFLITTQNTKK